MYPPRIRPIKILLITFFIVILHYGFPYTTRYIDVTGTVIYHGNNDDGMGIWFKKNLRRLWT